MQPVEGHILKCPNCKGPIDLNAAFCPSCGKPEAGQAAANNGCFWVVAAVVVLGFGWISESCSSNKGAAEPKADSSAMAAAIDDANTVAEESPEIQQQKEVLVPTAESTDPTATSYEAPDSEPFEPESESWDEVERPAPLSAEAEIQQPQLVRFNVIAKDASGESKSFNLTAKDEDTARRIIRDFRGNPDIVSLEQAE